MLDFIELPLNQSVSKCKTEFHLDGSTEDFHEMTAYRGVGKDKVTKK
jgi:hypothetical protein